MKGVARMAWAAAAVVALAGGAFVVALAQAQSPPDLPAAHPNIEATLPATDLSVEHTRSAIRVQLEKGGGASGDFQSATLPRNPLAPDATSVGSKMCVSCHAVEQTQFAHSQHDRAFKAGAMGGP